MLTHICPVCKKEYTDSPEYDTRLVCSPLCALQRHMIPENAYIVKLHKYSAGALVPKFIGYIWWTDTRYGIKYTDEYMQTEYDRDWDGIFWESIERWASRKRIPYCDADVTPTTIEFWEAAHNIISAGFFIGKGPGADLCPERYESEKQKI